MDRWVLIDWHDGTTRAFFKDGGVRKSADLISPEIDRIVKDKIAYHEHQIQIWQKLLEEKEI